MLLDDSSLDFMSDTPTPDAVLQMLGAHLAAKYVMVAVDCGLFEALRPRPLAAAELAQALGMPVRTTRMLADGLVAGRWLSVRDARYANTPVGAAFLSGAASQPDLRPILRMWNQVVYPQWHTLETSLRTEQATGSYAQLSQAQHLAFARGVEALSAPTAKALVLGVDFARHRRLLDLGGGTGSFLGEILAAHPHLSGTLFETPAAAALARRQAAQWPRPFDVIEGDMHAGALPAGFDAILLANVIHLWSPARNRALLQRVRAVAPPGARLLLVDFWTNPERTEPRLAALLAGQFQIVTGEGDVYSVDEVRGWLEAAGWRFSRHRPLPGAAGLIEAEAP